MTSEFRDISDEIDAAMADPELGPAIKVQRRAMAVESVARALMDKGQLLTWQVDEETKTVKLFAPDDLDPLPRFPREIAGMGVVIEFLPRRVAQ